WAFSLATTILNLVLIPKLRVSRQASGVRVSIIIPARNEARTIEQTVRFMLAQTYRDLEVIVVDDRSTDATGAILDSIADPRLIVIHGAELPDGWLGKPWACFQGSQRASGELLLFVDA